MSVIRELKTTPGISEKVRELLRDAIDTATENQMAGIAIVMIGHDGDIHSMSKMNSKLQLIGALQGAVIDAWGTGE